MKRITAVGLTGFALLFGCASAQAGHWRVGPGIAYVSGLEKVTDLYEQNYNNTHATTKAKIDFLLPVGLEVQGTYNWDSGVRVDLTLGPLFFMRSTDKDGVDPHLDHTEIPIGATVGYTFIPGGTASPYVRAGIVHHFASGTFVRSSSPGLLAAAGIEFARTSIASYTLEIATDKSEVELDRYLTRHDTVNLNTYDVVVSFIVKF